MHTRIQEQKITATTTKKKTNTREKADNIYSILNISHAIASTFILSYFINKVWLKSIQTTHPNNARKVFEQIRLSYYSKTIYTSGGYLKQTQSDLCNMAAEQKSWTSISDPRQLYPLPVRSYHYQPWDALEYCNNSVTIFGKVDIGNILNITDPTILANVFFNNPLANEEYISAAGVVFAILYLFRYGIDKNDEPGCSTIWIIVLFCIFSMAANVSYNALMSAEACNAACNLSSFKLVNGPEWASATQSQYISENQTPISTFEEGAQLFFTAISLESLEWLLNYIHKNTELLPKLADFAEKSFDSISSGCKKLYGFFKPHHESPKQKSKHVSSYSSVK